LPRSLRLPPWITFLARIEQSEDHDEAARLYRGGREFLQQGHAAHSVERFRNAVAIERGNHDYQLGLAVGLLEAGRLDEAQQTLASLLEQDSTDGAANLMMARVLQKEGSFTMASSFYHRAIYGRWEDNPAENRVKVRFELADLLTRQNTKEELLAELLPLQEEAPSDLETRMRIGLLFVAAGSPGRGADIFREALKAHPQDADAYAGLGEAEFARGSYRAAQFDFAAASRLAPDNPTIRRRLELCNEVLALDPAQRGLDAGERYARSRKVLELTLARVEPCLGASSPQSHQDLLDMSRTALKRPASLSRQSKESEAAVDLAERLWANRKKECAQIAVVQDEPLALVLAKLAQ